MTRAAGDWHPGTRASLAARFKLPVFTVSGKLGWWVARSSWLSVMGAVGITLSQPLCVRHLVFMYLIMCTLIPNLGTQ
jgi:hypothetical protein